MASELDWWMVDETATRKRERRSSGRLGAFLAGVLAASVVGLGTAQLAEGALQTPPSDPAAERTVPAEWRWSPPTVRTSHMFPSADARARLGRPGRGQ